MSLAIEPSDGLYRLRYRTYRRPFRRPLKTAHGVWSVREGIEIELRLDERLGIGDPRDRVGFGEIAPLSWFGSETLAEAIAFCQSHQARGGTIDDRAIEAIPDTLPACQFAFESARSVLRSKSEKSEKPARVLPVCRLLPAGDAAFGVLDSAAASPIDCPPTYKWKIGTGAIAEELDIFAALHASLPPDARLRLDANGGLDRGLACRWLETCDRLDAKPNSAAIEFLEQPLSVEEFDAARNLAQQFATPLALDESVASLSQLEAAHYQGWRGIYVIKPAIVGSPRRLHAFCQKHQLDTVFSSVFETAIGRDAGLAMAAALQTRDRSVGYGLDGWLEPATRSAWRPRSASRSSVV